MPASVVEYFQENNGYKCGYCKKENSRFSNGMWGHILTPLDYQDLIDRGWRRSGQYCYKPINDKSCCPMYTIRCAALHFKPSKSQKKILRKFKNYIENDNKPKTDSLRVPHEDVASSIPINDTGIPERNLVQNNELNDLLKQSARKKEHCNNTQDKRTANTKEAQEKSEMKDDNAQDGTNEISSAELHGKGQMKGKLFRRERWKARQVEKGMAVEPKPQSQEKSLEDWLDYADGVHTFEVRLVPADPEDEDFIATFSESLAVYQKYQVAIHRDPLEKCSASQFKRFLCKNPLSWDEPYGAFHRHFLVDGKIVAVGVVDILPSCVSSVYLFYDPDYSFLSLGTYTSLNEIAFVRQLQSVRSTLQFYYMGFYIHSCQKMRYKGQFSPSYLCCPETYKWQPIESCRPLLDVSPYSRLDPDPASFDANALSTVNDVKVLFCKQLRQTMVWKDYAAVTEREEEEVEVKEYGALVGEVLAKRMLLFRPGKS